MKPDLIYLRKVVDLTAKNLDISGKQAWVADIEEINAIKYIRLRQHTCWQQTERIMQSKYTEKATADLQIESSQSTTLRLLYEIMHWDPHEEQIAISIMVDELHNRRKLGKSIILGYLFVICCLEFNIMLIYKDKWYVFDEDEGEIRRQLKIDVYTHSCIVAIILILSITTINSIELHISFLILLPAFYVLFIIFLALRSCLNLEKSFIAIMTKDCR